MVEVHTYFVIRGEGVHVQLALVTEFLEMVKERWGGWWVRRDGVRTDRLVDVRLLRCSVGLVASGHAAGGGEEDMAEGEWMGVVRKAGLGFSPQEV